MVFIKHQVQEINGTEYEYYYLYQSYYEPGMKNPTNFKVGKVDDSIDSIMDSYREKADSKGLDVSPDEFEEFRDKLKHIDDNSNSVEEKAEMIKEREEDPEDNEGDSGSESEDMTEREKIRIDDPKNLDKELPESYKKFDKGRSSSNDAVFKWDRGDVSSNVNISVYKSDTIDEKGEEVLEIGEGERVVKGYSVSARGKTDEGDSYSSDVFTTEEFDEAWSHAKEAMEDAIEKYSDNIENNENKYDAEIGDKIKVFGTPPGHFASKKGEWVVIKRVEKNGKPALKLGKSGSRKQVLAGGYNNQQNRMLIHESELEKEINNKDPQFGSDERLNRVELVERGVESDRVHYEGEETDDSESNEGDSSEDDSGDKEQSFPDIQESEDTPYVRGVWSKKFDYKEIAFVERRGDGKFTPKVKDLEETNREEPITGEDSRKRKFDFERAKELVDDYAERNTGSNGEIVVPENDGEFSDKLIDDSQDNGDFDSMELVKKMTRKGAMVTKDVADSVTKEEADAVEGLDPLPMVVSENMVTEAMGEDVDVEYMELEITGDVPEFHGVDGDVYGGFDGGEKLSMPMENAEILVNRGLAERVEEPEDEPEEPSVKNDSDDSGSESSDTMDGYVEVEFLQKTPQFMGTDLEQYGGFEQGDTARIPEDNAEILENRGNVEVKKGASNGAEEHSQSSRGKDRSDSGFEGDSKDEELKSAMKEIGEFIEKNGSKDDPVNYDEIYSSVDMDDDLIDQALERLSANGETYEPKKNHVLTI